MRAVKKHQFEHGVIEYMLPSVPDAMALLGHMGIDVQDSKMSTNTFVILSKIIANMHSMIVKVDCKFEDEVVTNYDDLCLRMEAMAALSVVASEILSKVSDVFVETKKKSSKTQSLSGATKAKKIELEEKTQS